MYIYTYLISRHIQCFNVYICHLLHLMNSKVAFVLVSSGTQVQPETVLDPDNLADYLFVS